MTPPFYIEDRRVGMDDPSLPVLVVAVAELEKLLYEESAKIDPDDVPGLLYNVCLRASKSRETDQPIVQKLMDDYDARAYCGRLRIRTLHLRERRMNITTKENERLEVLIQRALDAHRIDRRDDLPWYDAAEDAFTDPVALELHLERLLDEQPATLTLPGNAVAALLGDSAIRLLFTRSLVEEILDCHLGIVDERIKQRISGDYTPEVSKHFHDRLDAIVKTAVDNFLRNRYTAITELTYKIVDGEMERTISNEVDRRFAALKKRLAAVAGE